MPPGPAAAVTAVLWAWAVAQYPDLLTPGLTISRAAADRPVLIATLMAPRPLAAAASSLASRA